MFSPFRFIAQFSNSYGPLIISVFLMSSSAPSRESPSSEMEVSPSLSIPTGSEELSEIPLSAASWSLSSAKPGNGIEQLLDANSETFWQSDGTQPHLITVQFFQKTKLTDLWLYFNFKADESYSPLQISLRIGNGYYDLQEIQVVDFREPEGWVRIPLALPPLEGPRTVLNQESVSIRDKSFGGACDFIRTYVLQIAIISNHQSGRDTHVRCLKLFGPKRERKVFLADVIYENGHAERLDRGIGLLTPEMTSMALIR